MVAQEVVFLDSALLFHLSVQFVEELEFGKGKHLGSCGELGLDRANLIGIGCDVFNEWLSWVEDDERTHLEIVGDVKVRVASLSPFR